MDTSESGTKSPGKFKMLCWRKTEKISWTERVKNEEELRTVKEKRFIPHTIKKKEG